MTTREILYASFRRRAESSFALAAIHAVNTFVIAVFLSIAFTRDASTVVGVTGIRNFIGLCAIITAVFSVVLSRLIAGSIMEGRRRELATWLLLGMRKRVAFVAVLGEFLISSAIADLLALSSAVVLNRYLALLLGFVTREGRAVQMTMGGKVVSITLMVSALQAAMISVCILKAVRGASIRELFSSDHGSFAGKGREGWRCAIGIALIGIGYVCAAASDGRVAVYAIIPTLALVVAGTFPFMDGLVHLRDSARRKRYLSDAARLVAYSLESRRASRDALVLSVTTILLASSTTAGGTLFAVAANAGVQAWRSCPNAAELSGLGGMELEEVSDRIDAELASHGGEPPIRRIVSAVPVRLSFRTGDRPNLIEAEAIPRSLWTSLLLESGRAPPLLTSSEDIVFSTDDDPTVTKTSGAFTVDIRSGDNVYGGRLMILKEAYVVSCTYAPRVVVIPDEVWRRFASDPSMTSSRKIAVWNTHIQTNPGPHTADGAAPAHETISSWEESLGAALRGAAQGREDARILVRSEEEELFSSEAGAMRFIGFFLSAVFLFAAITTVAYKFFQDAWHDHASRRLLTAIGMNTRVGRRASQLIILDTCAPPLVLSCLHTFFAIKMLNSITRFDVALPAARTLLITVTVFALFSVGITRRYIRFSGDT